jgi:hypothetical protein
MPLKCLAAETIAQHGCKSRGVNLQRTTEDEPMLKPQRQLITWLMAILPVVGLVSHFTA